VGWREHFDNFYGSYGDVRRRAVPYRLFVGGISAMLLGLGGVALWDWTGLLLLVVGAAVAFVGVLGMLTRRKG